MESDPLTAVIVVVPFEIALNNPVNKFTVPTEVFELIQNTGEANGLLYWSKVVAINCVDVPTNINGLSGAIFIEVNTGGFSKTFIVLVVVEVLPDKSVAE